MLVVCSILLAMSGVGSATFKVDVEGKLIKDDPEAVLYLVDFSDGLKRVEGFAGNPANYTKFLVDKTDCVKE